jgi:hypothetical protein
LDGCVGFFCAVDVSGPHVQIVASADPSFNVVGGWANTTDLPQDEMEEMREDAARADQLEAKLEQYVP